MTASKPHQRAWYGKPARIARAHIKLLLSVALGVLLFLVLPVEARVTRGLLAWNVAVGLYLAVVVIVIGRFELSHVRRRAAEEDEGGALILALIVAAAAVSLVAIFAEVGATPGSGFSAVLALSTVILSWFFIHVIFALHYAHEFYGEAEDGHKGGLKFPADDRPEYWDFVYFSFAIGTTSQVTDVLVTSKAMRRLVVGHGVVSFFYNVAVLALMVSIGGEFIKG